MRDWMYLRCRAGDGPLRFELVNVASGRRFSLNLAAALTLVSGDSRPLPGVGSDVLAGRGSGCTVLSTALTYYLASRRVSFADRADHDRTTRRDTLGRYLVESALPVPERFRDDESIRLGRPGGPSSPAPAGKLDQARPSGTANGAIGIASLATVLWFGADQVRVAGRAQLDHQHDLSRILQSFGSGLDLCVVARRVTGMPPGTYDYSVAQHALRPVPAATARVGSNEPGSPAAPAGASAEVLIVASFQRYQWRYRHERALRRLYIDAGTLAWSLAQAAKRAAVASRLSFPRDQGAALRYLHRCPVDSQVLCTVVLSPANLPTRA